MNVSKDEESEYRVVALWWPRTAIYFSQKTKMLNLINIENSFIQKKKNFILFTLEMNLLLNETELNLISFLPDVAEKCHSYTKLLSWPRTATLYEKEAVSIFTR